MQKPEFSGEQKVTKDHPARAWVDAHLAPVAEQLHATTGIGPNDVTILGGVLVALSGIMELRKHTEFKSVQPEMVTYIATILYALGVAMDKLDGVMAKVFAKLQLPHNSTVGGLIDTCIDRFQELFLAWVKMRQAHERGDDAGEAAALFNGISSMLPSFFRALAEVAEKDVPEGGVGLGMLGTRPARVVMGLTALYPSVGGVVVQPTIDTIGGVANTVTALQRLIAYLSPKKVAADDREDTSGEIENATQKEKDEVTNDAEAARQQSVAKAKLKLKYQTALAVIGIALLLYEHKRLSKKSKMIY